MMTTIANIIGVLGAVIVIIAYFLLSTKKINPQRILFPLLNIIGSLGIVFSLFYEWNFSAFLMEAAWILISIYGILKSYSPQNARSSDMPS